MHAWQKTTVHVFGRVLEKSYVVLHVKTLFAGAYESVHADTTCQATNDFELQQRSVHEVSKNMAVPSALKGSMVAKSVIYYTCFL